MPDKLSHPKEVIVKQLEITTANGDVIDMIQIPFHVMVFEDLFNNVISGQIVFFDASDQLNNAPFQGQEKIKLVWKTPKPIADNFCTVEGNIVKVSNKTKLGENGPLVYDLHFISTEAIKNLITPIHRAFSGKINEMAQKVFDIMESDKEIEIESTNPAYLHKIVSPGWEPFFLLNWLAGRAVHSKKPASNFFFYETLGSGGGEKNQFYFKSIESLITEDSSNSFIGTDNFSFYKSQKNLVSPLERDPVAEMAQIEDFEILDTYDTIKNLNSGLMSSSIVSHDLLKKTINFKEFDYVKHFGQTSHLGKTPSPYNNIDYKDLSKKNILHQVVASHSEIHDNFYTDGQFYDKMLLERISALKQIKLTRLKLKLPGDSTRRVGDIIEFNVPALTKNLGFLNPDKYLRGKFLVSAVVHSFNTLEYEMNIELLKDSFNK